MFSSFGRFPINSFVDLVFLQYFLYKRFPEYAPVRTVPEPSLDGESRSPEPRVWGWTMGRSRQSLSELLDEEDQFVHRPYVINLFPGVEQLHRIYHRDTFSSRNIRTSRCEGVFDLWQLILCPQFLPGFLITDNVSDVGGAFLPFAYRPDRVCRQFGLDQAPSNVDLEFRDIFESMRAILFKPVDVLPDFDDTKYVPFDRAGCVLDTWVAYFHHLKSSVKRYEGQNSLQVFTDVQIMYKDPYFVTTFSHKVEKSAFEGTVAQKRKPLRQKSKGKKGSEPPEKKAKPSSSQPSSALPPFKKNSNKRSPKAKKEHVVGTRASERLKAKPSNKVEEESPPQSSKTQATTQGSSIEKDTHEATAKSPNLDHDSTPGGNADGEGVDVDGYVPDSASKEHVTLFASPDADHANSLVVVTDTVVIPARADDSPTAISSLKVAPAVSSINVVPSEVVPPSTDIAPPSRESASVEIVPILASLLPEDDAIILSIFLARYVGFLLSEDVFPRAYLKPAYSLFAEFLRFAHSHSVVDLLSSHKNKVMEDLKALSLFGFKGEWFEELSHRLDHHIPAVALEDLGEVTKATLNVELRNNELQSEIDCLKLELAQGEAELIRLDAKRKEIEEACAGLNVMFDI